MTCTHCFGSGESGGACTKCKGKAIRLFRSVRINFAVGDGKINTLKMLVIDVPPGVIQGTKVRLNNIQDATLY